MNPSDKTTPRRLFTIALLVATLVLQPFCMLWSAIKYTGDFPPLHFSLFMVLMLLAGITVLIIGRSRWRWLLLFLILPYIYYLFHEMDLVGSILWSLKHHHW